MRYFIGYVLENNIAEYHKELSDDIAAEFGLSRLSRKIPPHITLKAPFEASNEQLREIESVVERFAKGALPAKIAFDGFGSFDRRVIFINVFASIEATNLAADFSEELQKIPWLTFERTDNKKNFHATIAYAEKRGMFDRIQAFLASKQPHFEALLNNICILRKEAMGWVIHKKFLLEQL